MKINKRLACLVAGVVGIVGLGAAGLYTNGVPSIQPALYNSLAPPLPDGLYSQLTPGTLFIPQDASPAQTKATNCCGPFVPVDTNQTSGAAPQTVKATPFQLGATLLDGLLNTQTSTAHAATSNTLGGVVVTESVSTAVGAAYTFTLTNSLVTAAYIATGMVPQVAIYSGTNTGGRCNVTNGTPGNGGVTFLAPTACGLTLTSVTPAVGSLTLVWTNNGTAALNGTMYIGWHL